MAGLRKGSRCASEAFVDCPTLPPRLARATNSVARLPFSVCYPAGGAGAIMESQRSKQL